MRDKLLTDLQQAVPLALTTLDLSSKGQTPGLVIVDIVNGFATVGAGYLAPQSENIQVNQMISEADRLGKAFKERGFPILAFLDSHQPGKTEPPYPPHCEIGTGEEELVPDLLWLEKTSMATLVRKDCINGFIGAYQPNGTNVLLNWLNENQISDVLTVGICTDICVMDFVLTLLSARNHGMAPTLKDIHVYERGCATYDLPRSLAEELHLGAAAAHPQAPTHHMGLYFMAARGALLVNEVVI